MSLTTAKTASEKASRTRKYLKKPKALRKSFETPASQRDNSFVLLLAYAFVLEAAAYMTLPYLSLHLRESFELSESQIGIVLMVSIWLRPLWAVATGLIGKKLSSGRLLQLGSLFSGLALAGLAISTTPAIGFVALVIANFGLSIWNPAVNALVFERSQNSDEGKKRVSQLNVSMYTGAAVGAGVASILATTSRGQIFSLSSLVFVLVAIVLSLHSFKAAGPSVKEVTVEESAAKPLSTSRNKEALLLAIASITYWASYAQFNGYFSLYATDWLKQPAFVGLAFSFLTIAVAAISALIARSPKLQSNDLAVAIVALAGLGISWGALALAPSLLIASTFLVVLAISEAMLVMVLAHRWSQISDKSSHLMQSLNFAVCNVGMGLGSLVGGTLYRSPTEGSILHFAGENLALCFLAGISLATLTRMLNKKIRSKDMKSNFHSHHSPSGLDIFIFRKDQLLKDPVLAQAISEQCALVQDKIWKKKFDTSHNSVEQDVLFLAWNSPTETAAGFLSFSFAKTPQGITYLYYSDAMILESFRSKSLLRDLLIAANEVVKLETTSSTVVNVVASGCIQSFFCFERSPRFSKIKWENSATGINDCSEFLQKDFGSLIMDGRGVIRAGWCRQENSMRGVWPAKLAEQFKFPLDVDYFNGDVLVRLYNFIDSETT